MSRSNLLPYAKELVVPEGIATTSFPSVLATCRAIGIMFDDWQVDLNKLILARDASGLYAADTVGMSIPRQVGKTFDVGALVFADSIINPGTTTIWTAHRFKVARETFNELRAWARSNLLAPYIDYDEITTGAGNESIPFKNGSRIVFAARERGAIRGFSKVSRLILDEAQILTEATMSDLAPTMNQATNPQIIMMGTPPKPRDPGEAFTEFRRAALAGETSNALYVELSADSSAPVDPSLPDFWPQIKKANPSFPHRTTKRAILRLHKLLSDEDDFRREVFGLWDAAGKVTVFTSEEWRAGRRLERPDDLGVGALGVAVSIDSSFSSIVAGAKGDEETWIKPLRHAAGVGWLIDEIKELQNRFGAPVVIDSRGPAAVLIPILERDGVRLRVLKTDDVLNACAEFEQLVRENRLRYEEAPELDAAVKAAKKRLVGDRWAWGRKGTEDITPLEGATFAAWAAEHQRVSAYDSGGVMTI